MLLVNVFTAYSAIINIALQAVKAQRVLDLWIDAFGIGWRASAFGRLFVGIRHANQRGVAPGGAYKRQSARQALHKAARHRDVGIARHGRWRREARAAVVAVDKVGQPRQAAGWCHQRVQPASGQRCVNSQLASVLAVVRQRVGVGLAGQAAGGFGFDQQFLAKVFQFAPGVQGVKSDHFGQRFTGASGA